MIANLNQFTRQSPQILPIANVEEDMFNTTIFVDEDNNSSYKLCKETICRQYDWCNSESIGLLQSKALCVANSLSTLQTTMLEKANNFGKIGKIEKATSLYFFINKLSYLANYLYWVYVQVYLNTRGSGSTAGNALIDRCLLGSNNIDDLFENYIVDAELKTLIREYQCEGVDLTCILECLEMYGKDKDCKRFC